MGKQQRQQDPFDWAKNALSAVSDNTADLKLALQKSDLLHEKAIHSIGDYLFEKGSQEDLIKLLSEMIQLYDARKLRKFDI